MTAVQQPVRKRWCLFRGAARFYQKAPLPNKTGKGCLPGVERHEGHSRQDGDPREGASPSDRREPAEVGGRRKSGEKGAAFLSASRA
jgi:hypothetical protein